MTSVAVSTQRFRLPNGITVNGLSSRDTMSVYADIFDDLCYLRHGVSLNNGDTVLDVGGNTGLFALYLNTFLTSARVLCFEPIAATCDVLSRNLAEHDRLGTRAFNIGIGEADCTAEFTYYPRFSNTSTRFPDTSARRAAMARRYIIGQIPTLSQPLRFVVNSLPRFLQVPIAEIVRRFHNKPQLVRCEVRTLSRVIRDENLDRIDLLKIDAERSEAGILAGIAESDWPKIRQTIIEVHDGEEAVGSIAGLLRSKGFRVEVDANPAIEELSLVFGIRDGVRSGDGRISYSDR